jgi:quaternary ammonium compound-resistance protein SugE
MAWFYLLLAAICETCWTFSLKYADLKKVKTLDWQNFAATEGLLIWLPLVGYVVFGVANIYFFSSAMKTIPTATAFAVWTAISMGLIKLSEVLFFKNSISWSEIFFLLLITVGIVGLKTVSGKI